MDKKHINMDDRYRKEAMKIKINKLIASLPKIKALAQRLSEGNIGRLS